MASEAMADVVVDTEAIGRAGSKAPGSRAEALRQDHLVVLVHGIFATVRDWTYVRNQLAQRLGSHFIVYASCSNETLKTLQGVDVAGERLANEVRDVVRSRPSLKHISIVGHSLGGLIARYAVALLYQEPGTDQSTTTTSSSGRAGEAAGSADGACENGHGNGNGHGPEGGGSGRGGSERWNDSGAEGVGGLRGAADARGQGDGGVFTSTESSEGNGAPGTVGASEQAAAVPAATRTEAETRATARQGRGGCGTIAGLQPACFITLATPHLGVRGRGQLPFLLGVDFLERIATPMAPLFVGRTGKQLFLTDAKPPLLLRMADPSVTDPPFLKALGSFHTRVAYANSGFDHMVGWQTSSIRRRIELPQVPRQSISPLYRHVMHVENCPAVPLGVDTNGAPVVDASGEPEGATLELAQASGAQNPVTGKSSAARFAAKQERMIRGLQTLAWRKVDVCFRSGFFPFFAHNNIHVKLHWLHFDGAGVVSHLADTMQELESLYLTSRL